MVGAWKNGGGETAVDIFGCNRSCDAQFIMAQMDKIPKADWQILFVMCLCMCVCMSVCIFVPFFLSGRSMFVRV